MSKNSRGSNVEATPGADPSRRARSRAQYGSPFSHRDGDREEHPARHERPGRAPQGAEEFWPDGKAQGRNARRARRQLDRNAHRRSSLRRPRIAEAPRLRVAGGADARSRHRRQHGDLQRHQRRAAEAAALRARRSAGGAPAVAAAVGPAAGRRRHRRILRLPRARQGCVRRPGRVPPDELRPDQARRARSREHRRRVGKFLRCARHQADPRPHFRGRRTIDAAPKRCCSSATPTGDKNSAATRTSSARCSR